MKVLKGRKRGFTLVEVSVALSVGAIILAMLSIAIVFIQKTWESNQFTANSLSEYQSVKNQIDDFYSSCVTGGLTCDVEEQNVLIAKEGDNIVQTMLFDNNNLVVNGENKNEYKCIQSIVFSKQNNQIIVCVEFTNQTKQKFVL